MAGRVSVVGLNMIHIQQKIGRGFIILITGDEATRARDLRWITVLLSVTDATDFGATEIREISTRTLWFVSWVKSVLRV
jgi:hypothetical protein